MRDIVNGHAVDLFLSDVEQWASDRIADVTWDKTPQICVPPNIRQFLKEGLLHCALSHYSEEHLIRPARKFCRKEFSEHLPTRKANAAKLAALSSAARLKQVLCGWVGIMKIRRSRKQKTC